MKGAYGKNYAVGLFADDKPPLRLVKVVETRLTMELACAIAVAMNHRLAKAQQRGVRAHVLAPQYSSTGV